MAERAGRAVECQSVGSGRGVAGVAGGIVGEWEWEWERSGC